MEFQVIDMRSWPRREYFEHYHSAVPCTYSVSLRLDVSAVLESGAKLYPAMLYSLAAVVNRHAEFRTAIGGSGEVGVFSEMLPCYTVFHPESETFSNIWTEYRPRFADFLSAYRLDIERYGRVPGFEGKPGTPPNSFTVSMIPWISFDGFNLNLQKGYDYLLPIFTMGKYCEDGCRRLLPLAIQVHHAVCDGFHVSRFAAELQELLNDGRTFEIQ